MCHIELVAHAGQFVFNNIWRCTGKDQHRHLAVHRVVHCAADVLRACIGVGGAVPVV
jgi:hypothetical protein